MPREFIDLEWSQGQCVVTRPRDDHHRHRAPHRSDMRWRVRNFDRDSRDCLVELRELEGVVYEAPPQLRVPAHGWAEWCSTVIGQPNTQAKYSIWVDGAEKRDPYIVIDEVVQKNAGFTAALAALAAGLGMFFLVRSAYAQRGVGSTLPSFGTQSGTHRSIGLRSEAAHSDAR